MTTTVNPRLPSNSFASVVSAEHSVGTTILPTESALVSPVGAHTTQPVSHTLLDKTLSNPNAGVRLTSASPTIGVNTGFAGQAVTQTFGAVSHGTFLSSHLPVHLPATSLFPAGSHF